MAVKDSHAAPGGVSLVGLHLPAGVELGRGEVVEFAVDPVIGFFLSPPAVSIPVDTFSYRLRQLRFGVAFVLDVEGVPRAERGEPDDL